MDSLKRCPFCGGEPIVLYNIEDRVLYVTVKCSLCSVQQGAWHSWNKLSDDPISLWKQVRDHAITSWNVRTE